MTGTNLKTKAKPAAETRCLGYARISTYGQTLDAQLEQLRRDGCTQAYKEKVSGARTDRRQLFRMLKGGAPGGARRGRFVRDSPLEGDGFELSVPREIGYGFGGFGPFSVAFGSPVGRDPSPKGTHPLATRN